MVRELCPRCLQSFKPEPETDAGKQVKENPFCPDCLGEYKNEAVPSKRDGTEANPIASAADSSDTTRQEDGLLSSLRERALDWCRGRWWWARAPILLWFVWILYNHLADARYDSLFGGLNLGIHELGHYVFAPFGVFISSAGGTLLQLLAPMISFFMFCRQEDYFGAAVCFGWLSTNCFGIATYAGDARTMQLPLVSPGGGVAYHDWNYMLSELGMLHLDDTIAFLFRTAGTLSMGIALLTGTWMVYHMIRSGNPKTRS